DRQDFLDSDAGYFAVLMFNSYWAPTCVELNTFF
ncbi:hypothetical protein D030_1314B, partial [Vibrio parahaemolyticus AQ3810]